MIIGSSQRASLRCDGRPDRLPRDPRSGSFSPYRARPNSTVTNSLKELRTHFSPLVSRSAETNANVRLHVSAGASTCFSSARKIVRHTKREREKERIIFDYIFRDWVSGAETQGCRSVGSHDHHPRDIYPRGGCWSILSTLCSIETISFLMRFLRTI